MTSAAPQHTLEGWRRFVDSDGPEPVEILDSSQLDAMSDDERRSHLRARIRYHSALPVVKTPDMEAIHQAGADIIDENSSGIGSPRGLAISGPPNVGKTTALKQFGKALDRQLRRTEPERDIPVIYTSLLPQATGKKVSLQLAHFLGLPLASRDSLADITHSLTTVIANVGTVAVLLDEAHHLVWGKQRALEASDHVKHLADHTGVTFFVAGVNIEATGLFAGLRSNQVAGRYRLITISEFGYRKKDDRKTWHQLVNAFDTSLRLREHAPGTLTDLASYLHDRTGGYLGSLTGLIRQAAIRSIKDGTERIDQRVLDVTGTDHAAERRTRRRDTERSS